MKIIVAIDIMGGKCVRLTRGEFGTQKVYSEDPVETARLIEDHGLQYLHLVDLDGARNKRIENLKVLERIATATKLTIDFGGGIRKLEDVKTVLNAGAAQVTAGSIAVKEASLFLEWLAEFGREKLILGADCKDRKVSASGWLETTETGIIDFIKWYSEKGIKHVVCTDIGLDGMLQGPATDLYRDILAACPVDLVASGGITTKSDLESLREAGCSAAIIGKAVYEGHLTLKTLGSYA